MAYTSTRTRRQLELKVEITRIIALTFAGCFGGLLAAWVGINVVTGCGEVTRTIDGTYINGECVLVPWVDPNTYDHFIE